MYSTGEVDIPSLTESIVVDNVTLVNDGGVLKINPDIQLGGITEEEYNAIVSMINTKWTQDNNKISHWDTAYGWGNHAAAGYVTLTYLTEELKKYVTLTGYQEIDGVKNFLNGLQIADIPITKLQDDVLYIDSNVVIRGGLTMYYENGEIDLPSIKDEIGNAGYDGATGLASFDSSQFVIGTDGTVSIISGSSGLNTEELKSYLDTNKYTTETWVKAQGYASASSLSSLQNKVNDFLEGSDTDTIINKWKELEAFLSGLSESDNLATILATKWTTDNNLINQWNTAYGWGNHASVGYALKSYVDSNFVTLGTKQTITGEKNFTGGLKVNGSPIYYDATNKYWKLEGDLLVTGGVTMYGIDEGDIDSILDSLPIASTSSAGIAYFDSTYFSVGNDGKVTLTSAPSGIPLLGQLQDVSYSVSGTANNDVVLFKSANSATWSTKLLSEIGGSIKYPLRWTGYDNGTWDGSSNGLIVIPTSLKNPNAITFTGAVSATYDGSSAVTVNIPTAGGDVDLSNYLPLSGGTINGRGDYSAEPLIIKNDNSSYSGLTIFANTTARVHLGYWKNLGGVRVENVANRCGLAILDDGIPSYYTMDSSGTFTKNTIWHSGNDGSDSGLDADLLDGTHKDSFFYAKSRAITSSTINTTLENGVYYTAGYSPVTGAYNYGTLLCFRSGAVGTISRQTQFYIADGQNGGGIGQIFYRDGWNSKDSLNAEWAQIITNKSIGSYNAGSATKLQTARTIWGQSFDGTGNVSGNIYIPNNSDIVFKDSVGTDRLTFSLGSNNNLAIGYGTSSAGYSTIIYGNSIILKYGTSRIEGLRINSSGNLGINTDSPTHKLHVNGTLRVDGSTLKNTYLNLNRNSEDGTIYDSTKTALEVEALADFSLLRTYNVTTQAKLSLHKNGCIGIGTLSPSYMLDVDGDFRSKGIIIEKTDEINRYGGDLYIQHRGTIAGSQGSSRTGNIIMCTNGGNVGIGTTSPAYKLDINGSTRVTGAIETYENASGTTSTGFICLNSYYVGGNESWKSYIANDYYGGNWCQDGGFTHGMIFKAGRYGFNNFIFLDSQGKPIARLSASTNFANTNHHFVGSALFTGGITMYSDIRKKTKLQDVELSLSQIANAPLIEHYYLSDQNKTTHVGSIAQYWAGLNDWFCKKDAEGYYTMEIQNAALASAISIARHLERYESKTDKKIRQLKKRISQLEDELELLKKGA